MPLQVALLTGPGGWPEAAARPLREALEALAAAGVLGWQALAPATEVVLRQHLSLQRSEVLHLAVEAAALGGAYVTVNLADSGGRARSLNVQALAQALKAAAPALRLVVLQTGAGTAGAGSPGPHERVARALLAAGVGSLATLPPAPAGAADAFYRCLAAGGTVDAAVSAFNGVPPGAAAGAAAVCHGGSAVVPLAEPDAAAAGMAPAAERLATIARQADLALARLQAATAAAPAVPPAVNDSHQRARDVAAALRAKRQAGRFDVFLCHNSADKAAVKALGQALKERGILPWLDEWELPPGQAWQALLERQIQSIGSAAVCIGPAGISPWHQQEMRGFISEFVDRHVPVIPVLLPGAPAKPELPLFLKQFTWVDFRRDDPDPYRQLVWGITGHREDED
jgi:TIR domain